jgi:type IV pilus assembly PilO-like protein
VKKKLAGLDMKLQLALVVLGLVLAAVGARMLVVSPQNAKASNLQQQIDDVVAQAAVRRLQAQRDTTPQVIHVADLFRLAKAIPDREDMPGIILTISQVARSAGVRFETIEPQDVAPSATGDYRIRKIHLAFEGDFYALSDFLFRLRSLVAVRDGKLDARGRLFTVERVTFSIGQKPFPTIAADVTVAAYINGSGPDAIAPTTTGTDTTATTPTPAGDGATAAGAPVQ